MVRLRVIALLLALPGLLLAGCAAPADGPDDSAPATPGQPEQGLAPAGHQQETLGWLVAGVACAHASQTQEAIHATLLPELEGVTYGAAPVDPATIGQEWSATVADAAAMVGFEVTFWRGAVGPGGEALAMQVGLPPFDGDATVEGEVPEGAEFVSAFACSGKPGSVTYSAALAPLQVALL